MTDGTSPEAQSTQSGEVPDELVAAIEANPEAVARFVERLDAVTELLDLIALGEAALDDEMVASLAGTGTSLAELADAASDDDTRDGLTTLLAAVGDAERRDPPPTGVLGLARQARDPEVKQGLGYLLALAGALGSRRADDGTAGE